MSLASILLPNFNFEVLLPVIGFIVVGILFIYLGEKIPFGKKNKISNYVKGIGAIMILSSIVYWFAISFVQDIFSNPKYMWSGIALIVVLVFGYYVFRGK